eukprot:1480455-Prymnesium_polylepis.1
MPHTADIFSTSWCSPLGLDIGRFLDKEERPARVAFRPYQRVAQRLAACIRQPRLHVSQLLLEVLNLVPRIHLFYCCLLLTASGLKGMDRHRNVSAEAFERGLRCAGLHPGHPRQEVGQLVVAPQGCKLSAEPALRFVGGSAADRRWA